MNAPRRRALSTFSFVALALPSTAFAQAATAPAPSASAPTVTTPTSAPEVAPAAPAAAETQAPAAPEVFPRFRWGISGFGGPLLAAASGGVGGVDTRFGYQINRLFGVYGQPVALIGAGTSSNTAGASASGVVAAGVGALADVTFLDMFFLAAGPELIGGVTGNGSSGTSGTSASGSSGVFFSMSARAGIALGSVKPDKRQAFTINLDLRTIFTPGDPLIIPALALGYDSF